MKKKTKNRVDIYEKATQRIIEMLEEGVPWRKTWGQKALLRIMRQGTYTQGSIGFY